MITREKLKREINNLSDEHLETVYRVMKALEMSKTEIENLSPEGNTKSRWHDFINDTYASLADAPMKRGEQGMHEHREAFE